jgi:hypothetical protein
MLVSRVSSLTGKTSEREIDVTEAQLNHWKSGVLIQHAMPNLSTDDREFLISGITPEEWNSHFGNEDEEDY